jgi:hypothetical protein
VNEPELPSDNGGVKGQESRTLETSRVVLIGVMVALIFG